MKYELMMYLNQPIPRKQGLLGVGIALSGTAFLYVSAHRLLEKADDMLAQKTVQLEIYDESTKFLMERADDRTLAELDKHLDYWRVINEMPISKEED